MELANGKEPDGITYKAYLSSPNWVVEVAHPNGTTLIESFHWTFEPRCGPDVADIENAEKIMDKLINRIRRT